MKKLLALLLCLMLMPSLVALADLELAPYSGNYDERLTIRWAGGHDTTEIEENDAVIAFLEEKFNVDLEVVLMNRENMSTEFTTKALKGDLPDIFWFEDIGFFTEMVDQEMCLPLSEELLQQAMPVCYEWLMELDKGAFNIVTLDGVIYGLPRPNADGRYTHAPFWRKDWLAKIGYTDGKVPMTLQEVEDAFYKFKELDLANECCLDENNKGKMTTYALSDLGFAPIFGAFGALPDRWVLDSEGKVVYGAVHPGMKDALALLAKWYKDGLIDPEFITGEPQGAAWSVSNTFMNGVIGFSSAGYFYTITPAVYRAEPHTEENRVEQNGRTFRAMANQYGYDNVIQIGYNPVGYDGVTQGNDFWGTVTQEAVAFNADLADDPDGAKKLARIFDIIEFINGTFEGYLMVDKWDVRLDQFYHVEGMGWDKVDPANYERPSFEPHGNMFNTLQNPFFKGQVMEYRYGWADSMPMFNTPGYSKMLIPVVTPAWAANSQALDQLRLITYVNIIRGITPVDAFDDFVAEWYANGGEEATAEANAWYNTNAK